MLLNDYIPHAAPEVVFVSPVGKEREMVRGTDEIRVSAKLVRNNLPYKTYTC